MNMCVVGGFKASGAQSARELGESGGSAALEPHPPLSARTLEKQRERGFSHAVAPTRKSNVGADGKTIYGRAGNDPSGFLAEAAEEYKHKAQRTADTDRLPPIDRLVSPRPLARSMRKPVESGPPARTAKPKQGGYLHAFPDYILDPEPSSRKFNRYYPHDVPMPPTHRATVLATQGPGFLPTTNVKSFMRGSNRLPVSGKIPISEEVVTNLRNENGKLKDLLGKMMEVEDVTNAQLSKK